MASFEETLENAVIEDLKDNVASLAGKTVKAYAGESPTDWIKDTVSTSTAVMLHIGEQSGDDESEDYGFIDATAEFYVYTIVKSTRSGDESKNTSYNLLAEIRTRLHKNMLNGAEFVWKGQGTVYTDSKICIMYQKYKFNFNIT